MKHARTIAIVLGSVTILGGCGEATSPARAAAAPRTAAPTANATPVANQAEPQVDLAVTPQSTVQQMLALAEDGDWGAYVDDFYGEQHKFRPGKNDRDQVVKRLSQRSDQVIEALRQVADMQPTISEDGTKAVYDFGGGRAFTLFLADDGRWTFHL